VSEKRKPFSLGAKGGASLGWEQAGGGQAVEENSQERNRKGGSRGEVVTRNHYERVRSEGVWNHTFFRASKGSRTIGVCSNVPILGMGGQ